MLTISLASLVNWKVLGRTSILVARSSLSRRSVEILNLTWSPSNSVTFDFVSLSPKGSSLGITKSTFIRPGRGSFWSQKRKEKEFQIRVGRTPKKYTVAEDCPPHGERCRANRHRALRFKPLSFLYELFFQILPLSQCPLVSVICNNVYNQTALGIKS